MEKYYFHVYDKDESVFPNDDRDVVHLYGPFDSKTIVDYWSKIYIEIEKIPINNIIVQEHSSEEISDMIKDRYEYEHIYKLFSPKTLSDRYVKYILKNKGVEGEPIGICNFVSNYESDNDYNFYLRPRYENSHCFMDDHGMCKNCRDLAEI